MEYHVLASGSKGNATFVYDNETGILIDCGISRKQLLYRLNEVGFNEDDIHYVLLTHDHYDHKKNVHLFDKKIIYSAKGNIELDNDHILKHYNHYNLGKLDVEVLKLSHDATNTVGYIIRGEESLLYMTDTGVVSQKNRKLIQNLNYYIIESNHDIDMLNNTRRPIFLKRRIAGDKGHLNNEDSAIVMSEVMGNNTKEITLAHLSAEANSEEKALETYHNIFNNRNISFSNIKVAHQVKTVSGGKYER